MNESREERLNQILAEYLAAVEGGHAHVLEDLEKRHPDLAEELRAFRHDQERFQRMAECMSQPPKMPAEAVTLAPTQAPDSPAVRELPLGRVHYFGDYELLEEIGRGGMGVVYRARQVSLKRIVALKMILIGQLADEADVRRFHAEAEAAAKLDHPGIVPVFEAGQHEGHHYFTMAFVEGKSLALQLLEGLPTPREAAAVIQQVATAVAYAHLEGVIHRDLKPANILIDKAGQPRLTDFGLAKRIHAEPGAEAHGDLTATGQVLGTPSYMAPEQAAGRTKDIGPGSDVYSLGAVLYCALTGRPPFQAASTLDTLLQVIDQDPVPPRALNSAVPRDLETICLKCLAKEPHQRFASARQLADDLDRFLNGQPIHARPTTRRERVVKWIRRRPAAAALMGVSAAAALGLVALGIALVVNAQHLTNEARRRESAERERANEAARREEAERDRGNLLDAQIGAARSHVYSSELTLAAISFEKKDTYGVRYFLDGLRPKEGEKDLRGFEWYYLWGKNNRERLSLPPITLARDNRELENPERMDGITDRRRLAFSPDGKLVATRRHVCDAVTGKPVIEYDQCIQVCFSPDGKFLCAGDVVVDLATKKKVKIGLVPKGGRIRWEGGGPLNYPLATAPLGFLARDNALVVLHFSDQSLKLYDPVTGKETVHDEFKVRKGHTIIAAALAEKRGLLAVASAKPSNSNRHLEKDEVEVWDLIHGGHKLIQLEKLPNKSDWDDEDLRDVLFSPDGATLAVITRDNAIRLCDPETGKERVRLGQRWRRRVVFSQDSKALFALGWTDVRLEIWDVATGKELVNTDIGFAGSPISEGERPEVALSPNGKTYATGGGKKVAQLWDTVTGQLRATFLGHQEAIVDLTFSPDGNTLATQDIQRGWPKSDANVKLWNTADDNPAIGLPLDTSAVTVLDPSPDGKTVAVGYADGTIRLCEAGSLKERQTLGVTGVEPNPDPKRGEWIPFPRRTSPVDVLRFSSDGKQLAASHGGNDKDHLIDIWDLSKGRVVDTYSGSMRFTRSFDGKVLATTSDDAANWPESWQNTRSLTIWDLASKKPVWESKGARVVTLTRDGHVAAAGAHDSGPGAGGHWRIKVWDAASRKERDLARFPGRGFVTMSPDGKTLARCNLGLEAVIEGGKEIEQVSGVRLIDVATGQQRAFLPKPTGYVPLDGKNWPQVVFSPDSKMLVTVAHYPEPGSSRNKFTLWEVATGKELATLNDPEKLTCVLPVFSPNRKTLATLSMAEWNREFRYEANRPPEETITMKRTEPNGAGSSGGGTLQSMRPVYEIHLWDVATRERRNRFIVSWKGTVEEMCFSSDGQNLYTLSTLEELIHHGIPTVNRLQVWDVTTGKEKGTIGDHGTRFHALAYAADGRLLALTEQQVNVRRPRQYPADYKVRIWDVARQKELATPQTFTATEMPLELDPGSLAVASNTRPKDDAWESEFKFGSHSSTAISRDGKVKAVRAFSLPLQYTGPDGKVKTVGSPTDVGIMDAATGKVLHVLKGHGQWVCRLAFSPDGKTLAIGEYGGAIKLWNVAAGRLLLTLPGHAGQVTGLAFHADGRVLASCSDREIRLWRAATDEEVAGRKP